MSVPFCLRVSSNGVAPQLPVLCGWLEKKSPSLLAGWQKRYVAVATESLYYWPDAFPIPPEVARVSAEVHAVPLFAVRAIEVRLGWGCHTHRMLSMSLY